ncbi:MAG: hypothetical protein AABX07_00160 [Nanoarchaeota archaeon]
MNKRAKPQMIVLPDSRKAAHPDMDNSVGYMTFFQNYPDRKFCANCDVSYRIFYIRNL